jgi:beta-lactamase regulating signal transducer with metallopeptidase domain
MHQTSVALSDLWFGVGTHLWQTSLVLVVVLLSPRLLRRGPAAICNTLLLMGLIKLLVPLPLLKAVIGGPVDAAVRAVAGSPALARMASPVITRSSAVLYPAHGVAHHMTTGVQLALTLTWAAGAAAVVTFWVMKERSARTGSEAPFANVRGEVSSDLRKAILGTGIPGDSIFVSDEPVVPHVAGLVRPRIVLPARLVTALGTAELRCILLHEDAHRRRREPVRLLFARAAAVVFFFYPLLWPLLRRLRETAEMACDEAALAAGAEPAAYSRALAAVVDMRLRVSPSNAAFDRNNSSLLKRRTERLSERRCAMRVRHRAVVIAVAAAVILTSALALTSVAGTPTTAARAPDPPAKPAPVAKPAQPEEPAPVPEEFYIETMVPPEYPEEPRQAGVEAIVLLELTIAEDHSVIDAKPRGVLAGHPPLDTIQMGEDGEIVEPVEEKGMEAYHEAFVEAATEAAMQWKIETRPAGVRFDNPTLLAPIQFRLEDDKEPE